MVLYTFRNEVYVSQLLALASTKPVQPGTTTVPGRRGSGRCAAWLASCRGNDAALSHASHSTLELFHIQTRIKPRVGVFAFQLPPIIKIVFLITAVTVNSYFILQTTSFKGIAAGMCTVEALFWISPNGSVSYSHSTF